MKRKITVGSPGITRAYLEPEGERAVSEMGSPIKFVATTEGVKRDGLDLRLDGLDTTNYERNPVFLWVHNYAMPPLGKVTKIRKLKKRMEMSVLFDQDDDFAVDIERKYREGFLTAVSIGWIITEYERGVEGEDEADYIVTGSDLLDLSAVPVPGDPDALMPRELAAVRSIANLTLPEGPVGSPAHGSGTAGPSGSFTTSGSDFVDLNRTTVLNDWPPARDEETSKTCDHEDDEGAVDWKRAAAEMVDLLNSGTETPDVDREARYRHLTRHYRQAGRTAPELLPGIILDSIDVGQLFVEGEWDIYQEGRRMDAIERVRRAAETMRDAAENLIDVLDDVDEPNDESETENRSFIDALGTIRDAIVLPEDEGESNDAE
jgi:hypothetical protein